MKKIYIVKLYCFHPHENESKGINTEKSFFTKKEAFVHGRQCLKSSIECEMHRLKNENNSYDNDYYLYLEHTLTLLNTNKKIMSFENQRGILSTIETFKVFSKKPKKSIDN